MENQLIDNEFKPISIDPVNVTNSYIKQKSWRVKENSNVSFSIGALILHQSTSMSSAFWLNSVYSREVAFAHKNADIHIHDLGCFTKNAEFFLKDGNTLSFEDAEKNNITEADIITYNPETRKEQITHATDIGKRKVMQETFVILDDNGDSLPACTSDHKHFTTRGWIETKDLIEGDEILDL